MLPFFKKLFGSDTTSETNVPNEIEHINQELYKKGAELAEKNKTLLLLRKIDEIILSSVTNPKEIAKKVTSLLVTDANFQLVAIFMLDKQNAALKSLALSESNVENINDNSTDQVLIPLSLRENIIVQAVEQKTIKVVQSIDNILQEPIHAPEVIKCAFIYPLIARSELIGAMVIALPQPQEDLSAYTGDLLDRLVQVVGIAMDNALLYGELQDANEKLKVLDKLKDEFVSLASHELRTPMTAIKSYLWMTQQPKTGALNETQKLYIDRAYISVERLIKLVNDMLNISRIESGRLTVEMSKVDIVKVAQEVIDDVTPRSQELGIKVILSPATIPPVIADADKIKEVLFNLIGNSLKFTPKDGVINILFEQKNDMIEVKVKDTGSGISSENLPKLFQKFSMLPESYVLNQSAAGTGLGLYISRSIVEIHRGKIWAASEGEGKGSEFTFTLKAFNEKDFSEINANNNPEKKAAVGIVHTQV